MNEYFYVYTVRTWRTDIQKYETYGMYATKEAAEEAVQFIKDTMSNYYEDAWINQTIVWC